MLSGEAVLEEELSAARALILSSNDPCTSAISGIGEFREWVHLLSPELLNVWVSNSIFGDKMDFRVHTRLGCITGVLIECLQGLLTFLG